MLHTRALRLGLTQRCFRQPKTVLLVDGPPHLMRRVPRIPGKPLRVQAQIDILSIRRSVVLYIAKILFPEITPRHAIRPSYTDRTERFRPPFFRYLTFIRSFHTACSVHAESILLPEWAFPKEVHFVVSKEGVVDQFM